MSFQGKNWRPLILVFAVLTLASLVLYINAIFGDSSLEQISQKEKSKAGVNHGKYRCPLDGAALHSMPEGRPVAVIIDNLPAARPQSGLKNADLVYETLAEGGITRMLAVFYHGKASVVGPIRSARPYFIEMANSLNGILVHSGGSPEALEYMKSSNLPHLDEFNHSRYFWRIPQRQSPHNLYSSTDKLHQLAQDVGLNAYETQVPQFEFVSDSNNETIDKHDMLLSDEVKIYFPKRYEVNYTYDPDEKLYWRFIAGESHMDEVTNSQLSPRNIIVQFVKTRVIDGQGRLEMGIAGHGRALVFTAGTVIEAVWEKSSPDKATVYKTINGEIVKLLPGQSWIEIVPECTKVIF